MSENLQNIDDLFKKAIDEHEDTPSSKVWDAIDKNLDKKKVVSISRKYNKLKWAAAILLLFSAGMAMYVWQTRMQNKELVKQNNINKSSKSKTETEIINNNDKKSTPGIKTTTENSKDNNNEEVNAETTKETSEEKQLQVNSSQQKIIAYDKKETEHEIIAGKSGKPSKEIQQLDKQLQEGNKGVAPEEKEGTKEMINDNTPGKYSTGIPMIFNRSYLLTDIRQIQSANPFLYKPWITPGENTITTENKRDIAAKQKSPKTKNNSPFSATIFYSPEFVSANVKDDHPRYREDNRHEIKNSEKQRSSSTYGVLLNYNTGSKWTLQSGVSIFTRVTDITPKTIYARPDNGGNVNYRLSCSAGSAYVPLKSGAAPAQGDSTKILSAKNTLQYVSIPVSIKYNLGKGKFNVVTGVGIAANILSKGKVETVIATSGGNERSTNNIEGLKSSYFNSQLSLGAEYHLSKKISINFTPKATLALSSINKNAAVKTKLNSFGLSAGVTIKL